MRANIDRHLDVKRAVFTFLRRFEGLSCLPFISDAEMPQLFGEEVNAALTELGNFNQREQLCQYCSSRCCLLVHCEIYSADFNRCPVHSFRPALCRMHFCKKYTQTYPLLVKGLGDIYLESLIEAAKVNQKIADFFNSPVLNPLVPALVTTISELLIAVRENHLDESSSFRLIQVEIEKYGNSRTPHPDKVK
jgi:hypothetical protein